MKPFMMDAIEFRSVVPCGCKARKGGPIVASVRLWWQLPSVVLGPNDIIECTGCGATWLRSEEA